jgi:prolipoprotein diacylglyceryl transferase
MRLVTGPLASIPSPSHGTIDVGPLSIHMYGLMLLLAIAAGIYITGRRWVARGGDWDLILRCAVWGVAFGIIGARAYHVLTSWNEVPSQWWGPFAVWKGGLGVWGGVAAGVAAGAVVAKRAGANVLLLLDCLAPALLVAQGIGRIGNYFNQELFGKPTSLPWGLEIDLNHRPERYVTYQTFHPTFLYELIYDFAAAGVLVLIGARYRIRPPGLFALYVAFYTFGRFFEELLRVDPAHHFAGLRLNAWVSIVLFVGSLAFFVWWQFIRPDTGDRRPMRTPGRRPARRGPAMAVPRGRVRPPR